MDESATRRKKIDPKLYEVGWEQVPESRSLTRDRNFDSLIVVPDSIALTGRWGGVHT